jgi:hypothetical protein
MEFARVSKTNTCAEHSSKCVLLGGEGRTFCTLSLSLMTHAEPNIKLRKCNQKKDEEKS